MIWITDHSETVAKGAKANQIKKKKKKKKGGLKVVGIDSEVTRGCDLVKVEEARMGLLLMIIDDGSSV